MTDAELNRRFDRLEELIRDLAKRLEAPLGQLRAEFADLSTAFERQEKLMSALERQMAGINQRLRAQ